ncbi:MAG: protein kinase [Anaerolineae bacterium]|jgi:pSer/pThr/pTyr-binding forkhead associated (FHA) protein|nr:protein kinase [Anaerolineae bacterium]MDX9829451.1 protein kinase [Anaerolineae bacterium]
MLAAEILIVAAAAALALLLVLALVARVLGGKSADGHRARCTRCGAVLPDQATSQVCPSCQVATPPQPPPFAKHAPGAQAGNPRLVAIRGPLAPREFPIDPAGLAIGRHSDNDVVLLDELMVSRFHAAIAVENGQYVLYDRDSVNGTWLNEQRVFRHVLTPGDRIQIWQSQFAFQLSDTPAPARRSIASEVAVRPTIHVAGEEFCHYHLETLIGRGGMSEVFRARDAEGRAVAIKILQQTDPYLVTKFVQEGNEIGPLLRGHDNIVYVHEFGQSPDDRLYIVMEYVDAPSLRKLLHGPLEEAKTVRIMGQVCSALAFAHQNNVVHRDIKPENILVSEDGVVKVLDFGIAKLTSASTVTRDKIVGTPEYISPEQARGDPVQPASDVYSLGVVLYELLSGSVPFPRSRTAEPYVAAIEVVRQHLKCEPESLRKRNPDVRVSSRVERATMRALKKNVQHRYPTARELGEALGTGTKGGLPAGSPAIPSQAGASSPKKQVTAACLAIIQGPRQGERLPVGEEMVLGRYELGSANTTISRQHARIFYRAGSFWLEDTSRNGTWVNGSRVYGEVPLPTGATISIGENVIVLEESRETRGGKNV